MSKDLVVKAMVTVGNQMGGVGGLARLLDDPKKWEPVVPADMHLTRPPDVAADGTIECGFCHARVALAETEPVNNMYGCRTCRASIARMEAEQSLGGATLDESLKLGRGRWWVMPLAFATAVAIVIVIYVVTARAV